MYIDFEEVIRKQHKDVILEGKINITVKNKRFRRRLALIKDGVPVVFSKINSMLHKELTGLEYIKFWEGIKIIEVK